jgi:hypothetical protein
VLNYFVSTELQICPQSMRSMVLACPMGECFNTITTTTRVAT